MPEGIIKDPKQNPKEEDFSSVFCTDDKFPQYKGKNFKYSKDAQSYNRLYMAGEAILFDKVNMFSTVQLIDDIKISGEVIISCYNPVDQ